MLTDKHTYPPFLLQTRDQFLHGYYNLQIMLIDMLLRQDEVVALYELTHESLTVCYIPIPNTRLEVLKSENAAKAPIAEAATPSCPECLDTGEDAQGRTCAECCQHEELDHGICCSCEADRTDWLAGAAEDFYGGDR